MAKIPGLLKRGNVYWYERMKGGERTRVSLGTGDIDAALKALEKYRAVPSDTRSDTIAGIVDAFCADKVKEGRFSETTHRAARVTLNLLAKKFPKKPVTAIRGADMQTWFNAQRAASSEPTAQTHLDRVSGFFRWCIAKKMLVINPCASVEVGRVISPGRKKFCSAVQRAAIIDAAPDWQMRMILCLGFYCGLRRNEIVEARADWIDRAAGVLHVRKTDTFVPKDREERAIPLSKGFNEFLATFDSVRADAYLIEPTKAVKGRAIYRYDFRKPFDAHVATLKLDWVTPHVMRHTFASLLVSAGVSIYKVAVWLGDEVRTVERHYAKLIPRDVDIDKG